MKDLVEIINPHARRSITLRGLLGSLWRNKRLISQMTKREVVGRYKGSAMGLAWSFFNPIVMLAVYTYVFSEIFKTRWVGTAADESKAQFALILFVGMIVQGLFAEVFNKSPGLIISNVNYVKKVVFPLEILPVITLGAALFHSLVSFLVLIMALFIFKGSVHWTAIFMPVVIFPLIVMIMGFSWFLASLGVFARDIGQFTAIITTVLTFLSPVFYPVSAVPEAFRPFMMANPLTFIIEQAREVLIWGHLPDWTGLSVYMLTATFFAWAGFAWFQKTRKGFADVL